MSLPPPRAAALLIDGPAGALEALLDDPREDPQGPAPAGFGVICHPHPLHGGTMHNKVVYTVARACQERGMPTLRFNYRGVGVSAGSYDEGRGETRVQPFSKPPSVGFGTDSMNDPNWASCAKHSIVFVGPKGELRPDGKAQNVS